MWNRGQKIAVPALKTGRPSKFVPDAAAAVLAHVRRGSPRHIAANAAGLGRSTLMRWMARGKKELRGQFRDFWDAVKKAEAEAVVTSLERIQAAGKGGALVSRTSVTNSHGVTTIVEKFAQPIWTADAWLLERRHPDEFAVNAREIKALTKEMKTLAERAGILEIGLPLPPLQQVLAILPPDLRRAVEENLRREEGRR